jgi:hypothetical protein
MAFPPACMDDLSVKKNVAHDTFARVLTGQA